MRVQVGYRLFTSVSSKNDVCATSALIDSDLTAGSSIHQYITDTYGDLGQVFYAVRSSCHYQQVLALDAFATALSIRRTKVSIAENLSTFLLEPQLP